MKAVIGQSLAQMGRSTATNRKHEHSTGRGVRKEGGDVVNDSGDHTKIPIDPQGLVERGRVPCSNGKSRPAGRWSRTPDTVCLASAVNGGELVSEIRPN